MRTRPGAGGLPYRPDIDGLRAVAVVLVILYHLGVPWLAGGFIGVDVFFVISGYLIAGIIRSEMAAGRFSLGGFYERRIRRILPALALVVAASAIGGWFVLYPGDYARFGLSAVAALLSWSNILFWSEAGYFDGASQTKPLLHTWSLGVEEQFYILLPLLLVALARWTRPPAARLVILGLALASFAASVWSAQTTPAAGFFLLPARGWELLAGALLATGTIPPLRHRLLTEALAAGGLTMVAAAALIFDAATPFPGSAALLPVAGTAFLLYAGSVAPTLASRILSLPPVVLVGLISYSLYLWHWPIIVFYRYRTLDDPDLVSGAAILILTLVASLLSWRFVERPARTIQIPRRKVFTAAAASVAALLTVGTAIFAADGAPGRFPQDVESIVSYNRWSQGDYLREACFLPGLPVAGVDLDEATCLTPATDRPNYLLVGDSHAAHLWQGLALTFPEINLMQATASGCSPFVSRGTSSNCAAMMRHVFMDVLPSRKVDVLVLSARWRAPILARVAETIAYARPFVREIIVLGPVVEYHRDLPRVLAHDILSGTASSVARWRRTRQPAFDRRLRRIVRDAGGRYISTYDTICPKGDCTTLAAPGVPMQWDYGHLTAAGGRVIAERWRRAHVFP